MIHRKQFQGLRLAGLVVLAAAHPLAASAFPSPDRPIAEIVSPTWSSGPDRDKADENGQIVRALGIRPGMAVADIGAGSGYHTLRLSAVLGPRGVVYAQDIKADYLADLSAEVARRKLANVRIVVGAPDDPGLAARSVDRAILVHMYHEIVQPYALMWRLAGSLKPGARVGIVDLDRPTHRHGTPPALLKCEVEAVGYRQVARRQLAGGVGYFAIFEPPKQRPRPDQIKGCAGR
ncbi:methyltransferase domain-containing protein [Phenylobacterium sp.]|uniref:methyltransferase domain-containing protein n=1 Tax=Phenylobacterium sp. TaxID=1871053 RepID=UPI00286BD3EC|nr:methyltransferase domain-containing protein [Phenylobacterium sp.]